MRIHASFQALLISAFPKRSTITLIYKTASQSPATVSCPLIKRTVSLVLVLAFLNILVLHHSREEGLAGQAD
jgi:hypothetical protein